jgi:site-specific recombinase XerD
VELKDLRFHDLRHTFASHLVMSGVDVVTVQQLLGHAHINMTMRYAHLAPEHRAKAVRALDSALATHVSEASDAKTGTVENQVL